MSLLLAERRLILISGPRSHGLQAADELISRSKLQQETVYRCRTDHNALDILGRDFSLVIVDAYAGLNPDVIGRVSGTIVAGGAMLIICPELQDWASHADPEKAKLAPYPIGIDEVGGRYLARWARIINNLEGIEIYTPDAGRHADIIKTALINTPLQQAITADQQLAIDAVSKAATGQRKRPAIITADRGRGKSAALGLAAGELIRSGRAMIIIVTSSGFGQVQTLFKHAQAVLHESSFDLSNRQLQYKNAALRYIPADNLITAAVDCDLLIVDESASIGVARLAALLHRYPRIAFSSTEHGYEGSGRGFSLKFKQLIHSNSRGQQTVSLHTAIRWGENDPLEAWTQKLLLLESCSDEVLPAALASTDRPSPGKLELALISQDRLAEDEILLNQVFGLLVDAHYQTRPIDLRYLLDAPNTQIWAARHNGTLVGLVWLMLEGHLSDDIAIEIVAGRRRPQGHLAPQILAAHLGTDAAATLRCARIQRIVVRPELQNRGIGHWMLEQLAQRIRPETDYLASSFGADLALLRFWNQAGYQAARISDKPRAASGLRSALVIKPLSEAAHTLSADAADAFPAQLIAQLATSLQDMPVAIALELAHDDIPAEILRPANLKAAVLFAYAGRPYESSLAALAEIGKSLLLNATLRQKLSPGQNHLYIARTLQHQSWSSCAKQASLSGKKACLKSVQQSTRILLEEIIPLPLLTQLCARYRCTAPDSD